MSERAKCNLSFSFDAREGVAGLLGLLLRLQARLLRKPRLPPLLLRHARRLHACEVLAQFCGVACSSNKKGGEQRCRQRTMHVLCMHKRG